MEGIYYSISSAYVTCSFLITCICIDICHRVYSNQYFLKWLTYLQDGTIIRGQNEISHPATGSMQPVDKVELLPDHDGDV